jgi:cellulose synthase/poly-beta-1,6-N-acetylglucosamine synthase-like glycosyltransferase
MHTGVKLLFDLVLDLAIVFYLAGTLFLVTFISGFGVLLLIYLSTRQQTPVRPQVTPHELLSVTVQLPIYNEPEVVDRVLEACANLHYPPDKLHIQILDDSTDSTTARVREKVEALKRRGITQLTHIHRASRSGYKAGALALGLDSVMTECVAIFDADFVPETDFLWRTMPYFTENTNLALIQTRWSHLNGDYNWLTRAQALSIDAHFGVEQVARNRGRLPMSMNGTGGIWRASAIKDAGGWSSATLTEDLDLSYRAYLRGWDFLYLVDVAVPGELPPFVQTYKTQQARWAIGSTQCMMKYVPALLTAPDRSLLEKLMGISHLAQFAVHPVILMLFLLMPLLVYGNALHRLPGLAIVAIVGVIPPLLTALGQFELYEDWPRRLLFFPVQFIAAVAIVLNNSHAVLAAISHPDQRYEFRRTPKFRLTRSSNPTITDQLQLDVITLGELLLAVYACFGLLIALHRAPAIAPYMFTYAVSFFLFSCSNIHQVWQLSRH